MLQRALRESLALSSGGGNNADPQPFAPRPGLSPPPVLRLAVVVVVVLLLRLLRTLDWAAGG